MPHVLLPPCMGRAWVTEDTTGTTIASAIAQGAVALPAAACSPGSCPGRLRLPIQRSDRDDSRESAEPLRPDVHQCYHRPRPRAIDHERRAQAITTGWTGAFRHGRQLGGAAPRRSHALWIVAPGH